MSFWTKESLSLAQTESGKSKIDVSSSFTKKNPAEGSCKSTISQWDAPSKEENVRGGRVVKVETEN